MTASDGACGRQPSDSNEDPRAGIVSLVTDSILSSFSYLRCDSDGGVIPFHRHTLTFWFGIRVTELWFRDLQVEGIEADFAITLFDFSHEGTSCETTRSIQGQWMIEQGVNVSKCMN